MRSGGKDDIVAGRLTNRAEAQARRDEAEASQLRDGRHPPIGSHQKRLAEQTQHHAPRRQTARVDTTEEELVHVVEQVLAEEPVMVVLTMEELVLEVPVVEEATMEVPNMAEQVPIVKVVVKDTLAVIYEVSPAYTYVMTHAST